MKTILATTDFSNASRNAVSYAAETAIQTGAKLVLFTVSESYFVMPSLDDVKDHPLAELRKIADDLHGRFGHEIEIERECKFGLASDEIALYAEENDVDLIVMGVKGAGPFVEKVLGSLATTLIQKTHRPVLLVPQNSGFRTIKKIVFASDYKDNNTSEPEILKDISSLWKSQVDIVHVFPAEDEMATAEEAVAGISLDRAFRNIRHSFHSVVNKDVIKGLNEYVDSHDADMVVMSPRRHSFVELLFKEPHTKKMAFHSLVPLLIIH